MKNRYTSGIALIQKNKTSSSSSSSNSRVANRHSNNINNSISTSSSSSSKNDSFTFNNDNSIIKLRMPTIEVKEIYDIDYLDRDFFWNRHLKLDSLVPTPLPPPPSAGSASSSASSDSNSNFSISPTSNSELFFANFDTGKPSSSARTTPRSSISKSSYSSAESVSLMFGADDDDETFTFKDFVSTIITSENKEWHKLIIQDISKQLELKFKEFKKSFLATNTNLITSIYLNADMDLFMQVAERIFELALDEPNGILGTRIQLRLQMNSGKVVDVSELFAYDASTMATSEITVVLCEAETNTKLKRFIHKFRVFSPLEKYFALHIDPVNFKINKNRLYY